MRHNPTILLTACINPNGMSNTFVQDASVRKTQYINAIGYYLDTTKFNIVVVENSGYDLSDYFKTDIANGRLEMICYRGNDYNHSLGKGYGECLIIAESLKQSLLLKSSACIVKVSGRHLVKNIVDIIRFSEYLVSKDHFVVCEINKKSRGANSDLFLASRDFCETLTSNIDLIDEAKGVWFEHALYESIVQFVDAGNEFQFLPIPLNQEGQSGSMGSAFTRPPLRMYLLDAVKAFLYKFNILKVV